MTRRLINIFLFVCACFRFDTGQAQINLVLNGSFEDTVQCPIIVDDIKATRYWTGIDSNITIWDSFASYAMPDLMHTCATISSISVPLNTWFLRYPRTGNAMAAVLMYNDNRDTTWSFYQRDYLQGRLKSTLVAGNQYCLSFYTTITQGSTYAIDHIGAFLDDGSIDTIPPVRCPQIHNMFHPQVFDTAISNDTLHWTKIQGIFIANGAEKFITIGNFFTNDQVDTVQVHYPSFYASSGYRLFSYYLIDDVSVIAADAVADAGPDGLTSPTGDSVWVGNHDGYVPCRWYSGTGVLIDSNIGGFKVKPAVTTSYIMELEVCGHVTRDTVTITVAPAAVGSLQLAVGSPQVYPNPASDELTVENAKGCEINIYTILGQRVASFVSMTSRETIQIERLSRGVYLIEIIDPASGEKVTKRLLKE